MENHAEVIPLFAAADYGKGGFGGERPYPFPPDVVENQEERSEEPKPSITESKERKRNEVWDGCVEVLGYSPLTDSEQRLWGRMVASLQRAGASFSSIVAVADWYRRTWPDVDLTITAIEKWYSHFLRLETARKGRRNATCSECSTGGGFHIEGCSLSSSSVPSNQSR